MAEMKHRKTITTLIQCTNFELNSKTHDKKVNDLSNKFLEIGKGKGISVNLSHKEFATRENLFFVTIFTFTFPAEEKEVYEKIISD